MGIANGTEVVRFNFQGPAVAFTSTETPSDTNAQAAAVTVCRAAFVNALAHGLSLCIIVLATRAMVATAYDSISFLASWFRRAAQAVGSGAGRLALLVIFR